MAMATSRDSSREIKLSIWIIYSKTNTSGSLLASELIGLPE